MSNGHDADQYSKLLSPEEVQPGDDQDGFLDDESVGAYNVDYACEECGLCFEPLLYH